MSSITASSLHSRPSLAAALHHGRRQRFAVRAYEDKKGFNAVIDKATKKEIKREDVLKNQEENASEKRSVLGAVPKNGSMYPRPEVDRRPETGEKSFGSLMAFDGAGPETINGRLAMVCIAWAFVVERSTGLTVAQQLFAAGGVGVFNFLCVVQLLWYASLVPMFRGESPVSRGFLGFFMSSR